MSDSAQYDCPFCGDLDSRAICGNDLAVAIPDGYPVSPGHTLIIPRRRVASWFDLCQEEVQAVFDLVAKARERLDQEHRPDGYNIGINVGSAAGQTVFHVHVHLIPRYVHDVPQPRGGVRHVIPGKGDYARGVRQWE